MIVWLNGTFGAGKTTAAHELLDLLPGSTLYDPEILGSGLRLMLPAKRFEEIDDYQDLPAWRRMVVDTAAALLTEVPGPLVTPMALLRQEYRDEIFGALAARRIPVRHVFLDAEETILRERISHRAHGRPGDPRPAASARQGVPGTRPYRHAPDWIKGDAHVVDTTRLTPRQTAEQIAEAVRIGAGACDIVQTPEPTAETLAAGVLLFDDRDRVLLVDPTYKPGWEFPGGIVEPGEAPAHAGVREVAEELGIAAAPRAPAARPGLGGAQTPRLRRPAAALRRRHPDRRPHPRAAAAGRRTARLAVRTEAEAEDMLPPVRWNRLRWALRAREQGCPLHLEAGVPLG